MRRPESELGRSTYIYGVATAPEFRRRGLAGKLMREAMRLIGEQGDEAAFLIPSEEWLHGFYAKYGFEGAVPVTFSSQDGFDFGTATPRKTGPWSGGEPPGLRCPRHCTALTPRGSTALLRRNARVRYRTHDKKAGDFTVCGFPFCISSPKVVRIWFRRPPWS